MGVKCLSYWCIWYEAGECDKGYIEDSDECLKSCEDAYEEGE